MNVYAFCPNVYCDIFGHNNVSMILVLVTGIYLPTDVSLKIIKGFAHLSFLVSLNIIFVILLPSQNLW